MTAAAANHHCCVVEICSGGILIEGASGSGKSSLAFGLIEAARMRGLEAQFVTDDQALIRLEAGRVIAAAPPSIAGKAEIFGHGIVEIPHKSECAVQLVVRLCQDEAVQRMPQGATASFFGVNLPLVEAPVRHEAQSVRIVLARLGMALV